MELIVQNIRGAKSYKKVQNLKNNYKERSNAILMLTETALKSNDLTSFAFRMGYGHNQNLIFHDVDNQNMNSNRGVTIILSKKNQIENLKVKPSGFGDFLILSGKVGRKPFVIGLFYGSANPNDIISLGIVTRFCQALNNICQSLDEPIISVTGDFNFILNSSDASTNSHYNRKPRTERYFNNFLRQNRLIDLHKSLYPDLPQHTYKRSNQGNVTCSSRLDRFYSNAEPRFCDLIHGLFVQSDHSSMHARIDDSHNEMRRKQNRFADHLLKSKNFLTKMHTFLHEKLVLECPDIALNLPESYHNSTDENLDEFIRENVDKISKIKTPSYKKNFMVDFSTQLRSKKIDIFIEKVLNPNLEPDTPEIGLVSLGRIAAESTNKPELILNTITSSLTQESMTISKHLSRSTNGKLRGVIKQLIDLEASNQYNSTRYRKLVQKRDFLESQRNFKAKFQATNKHTAKSDKYTAYFLSNLVFSSRPKISKIVDKNGKMHEGSSAESTFIQNFTDFFQEEPSSATADCNTIPNFLRDIPAEKIRKIQSHINETNVITGDELDFIVKKNHKNSSPGLSGWSYAALKEFYPSLKPLILKFLNSNDEQRDALSEQLRARKVVFLRKPGRDPTLFGSYRPICLLEISYKLLSSILAERVKRYIPQIISPQQYAYQQGRSASLASRSILDKKNLIIKNNMKACLISVDYSCAFDNISHSFCFEALKYFKFPDFLIRKIKTLITQPRATLIVNNKQTNFFNLSQRGSGQGDPISSYCFLICIQILLIHLCYSTNIPRPEHTYRDLDSKENVISCAPTCFADDLQVFCSTETPNNIDKIIHVIEEFSKISNLKLNKTKTEVMFFNPTNEATERARFHDLKIVEKCKFVGLITIDKDNDQLQYEENFSKPNTTADSIMSNAISRNLSTIGSCIVYNSKISSLYTHILFNTILTSDQSKSLDKRAIDFIVECDNRFLVKKIKYFMPHSQGGMNLRSFEFAAKSLSSYWLKCILNTQGEPPIWLQILKYYLVKINIDIDVLFKSGHKDFFLTSQKLASQSSFWAGTMRNLSEIIKLIEQDCTQLPALPIFGGCFSDLVSNSSLSIFSPHGRSIANLIKSGFHIVAHFTQSNAIYPDLLNCYKYKTLDQINRSTNIPICRLAYTSITSSLSKYFHVILRNEGLFLNLEFTPIVKNSCIKSFFIKHNKGNTKIYKMLRKQHIIDNKLPRAPAFITAQRDYNISMALQRWESNLTYTPRIIALPGTSSFYFKVQTRQNWSREKNAKTTQNPDLSICLNCDDDCVSNSLHMFCECIIAQNLFKTLTKIVKLSMNHNLAQSPDSLIFMQGPRPSDKHERVALTDIQACTLHTLQKIALSDSRVTQYSANQMLHKNLITTVFANKSIERATHVYDTILETIFKVFKTRGVMQTYLANEPN